MRHAPTLDDFAAGPSQRLLSGRILLTGATGFLGQAILERLLSDHPATRIDVLIRARAGASPQARLDELTRKPAFAPWRARLGDVKADAMLRERVTVLPGSLADAAVLLADRPPYDVVLHAAGDVSFRPPLTEAFATNVTGPQALYEALCGGARADAPRPGSAAPLPTRPLPHIVHVSTAYVWTDRTPLGAETRLPHELDWRAELDHAERSAAAIGQAADVRRIAHTVSRGDPAGAHPLGAARPRGVRAWLVTEGLERARQRGWTDVYTYTKALGERVAEEVCAQAPLTVLRPTIIESALDRPFPGWLDGFKVTDPIIVAYAKGRLPAFPGAPELVLDIVPVDIVVNAVLAASRRPPTPGRPRYLHVGTSVTNPLRLEDLRRISRRYFAAQPWIDKAGRTIRPRPFRFVSPQAMRRHLARTVGWTTGLQRLAGWLPPAAGSPIRARLGRTARRLAAVAEFVALYEPYSCSATRYGDATLRALDTTRSAAERRREPLDVAAWRWDDYLGEVHLPAVRRLMAASGQRVGAAQRPPVAVVPADRPAAG